MYLHRIHMYHLVLFVALLFSVFAVHGVANAKGAEVSFKKCLECHPEVQKELKEKGAHRPFKGLECSSCHNPHAAKYENLVKDEISTLCRGCHESQNALAGRRQSHAPFEKGECLSCHKPHASKNPSLLKAKGQALCFGCHEQKGSFSKKNKHGPVREGNCLRCHSPHTSNFEALARSEPSRLCDACHAAKNRKAQKSHLGYPVRGTDCMSCHNPHGSDRKGLVRETQHSPFARERCRTCHNGLQSNDPLGLKGTGVSKCLGCHEAIQEDFKKINSHVGQGVFCVNCHSPHASDEGHLMKAKEAKVCLDCHEDTKEHLQDKDSAFKHPLLKQGKCSPCHRPHGSNLGLFFGDDEFKVCTACHERHAKFTHPLGEKAIDPRSKRDVACITCHNLMGSPYEFALRFDRKKELCIQCHKGY